MVWKAEGNCVTGNGYYEAVDYSLGRGALWMRTDEPEGGAYIFYPQWKANTYQIKYDPNCTGYTGTMENSNHTYDTSETLSPNQFSREEYTFAGWSTTEDGTVGYTDEQLVENLTAEDKATVTLYAVWEPDSSDADMGISESITTTDEVLVAMDAAFTVPCPDDPA